MDESGSRSAVRMRHAIAALCVLMLVVAALVQRYHLAFLGLPDQTATSDLLGAMSSLFGAVACLGFGLTGRSAMPRGRRAPWVILGVGLGLWALADFVWLRYEAVGVEPPYPGPADVLYFIGIPIMGLGLIGLARTTDASPGRDSRLTLDTLVLSSAFALVTYLLVLRTVVNALGFSVQTGLSVLYPISDGIFAAFAGVLVVRSHTTRERADLMLLTLGFALYWIADGYFAVAEVAGKDYTQSALGLGFVAGPLMIGLAATAAGTSHARLGGANGTVTRGFSAVLPDVGVFAAILACAAGTLQGGLDWVLTSSVLALMAYRQALIATSNQRVRSALTERVLERTASLQSLSDHHEGILASVGEGVIGVDALGRVTFANPAAVAMLGAEGDDLLGTDSCAITCVASPSPGHVCVLDLVRATETVVSRPDEEFARVDGERFHVEVTAAPRQGPGTGSGLVLVFRDTTERLAMSRMKNEFVSAVSHELRTPLTSIRGALEMLDDGDTGLLPPIAAEMVGTALRGSERLTRLVNDIIDVERLESGSFPMYFTDLEVGPIVETAVSGLEVLAKEARVELVVTQAVGWTRCDADRLVQALINLVGNAIKFSPPGKSVEISAVPDGQFVHFTVTDNGRGIPVTHLQSIFERFQQVEASDAREKAGTGLGLPITKSIVQQHGGRIWVDSLPGRGSTFGFTIPGGMAGNQGEVVRNDPPQPIQSLGPHLPRTA